MARPKKMIADPAEQAQAYLMKPEELVWMAEKVC